MHFSDEKRTILWTIVEKHSNVFRNKFAIAYDGAHQLYTTAKLPLNGDDERFFECDVALAKDSRPYTTCGISLQHVGPVQLEMRRTRTSNLDERVLTPIQIIDIIVRQSLTCPFIPYAFSV